MSDSQDDVNRMSKLLDDTMRILKDSVILLEFNAKKLRISEGIVKNLHLLTKEVEATIGSVKEKLSKEYHRLVEVGLTGSQLQLKLVIFENLRDEFYKALEAFKKNILPLTSILGILKKLLGVLEALLSSLGSVIPQVHPALEAKTIIHGLIP